MNDNDIEREIIEKGKTAPRVTPDGIDAVITSEFYFTAADGYRASPCYDPNGDPCVPLPAPAALELLTFCVLVLRNGFTVTGESACASPENFDAEIGRKIARQNAVAKIWPLEGYLLKQRLHDAA
ncbi:Gp49 family protein [Burkholderia gladioli]|uniref:Gp49 family protein n=1 Tax=Burkholderia gladioli TaxID=28095 RepID=UPI00163FAA59|nr:Gp49 family protein [Burkholderia gladioli]